MTAVPSPLSEPEIVRELADYEVILPTESLSRLRAYLELLLRWNRKVDLIGLKDPRTIVRRLFAESLYLAHVVELKGWLVDIGSGAGFPGLALKLVAPDLRVTLIEARQKRCAFLKEVVRQCRFDQVEVVADRFEAWAGRLSPRAHADLITTRAVEMTPRLLQLTQELLTPGGYLTVFTTRSIAARLTQWPGLTWRSFVPYYAPHGKDGIQLGSK